MIPGKLGIFAARSSILTKNYLPPSAVNSVAFHDITSMASFEHGREMPNGQPALLKRREYLRRDAAEQRWKELLQLGWSATDPAWGTEVEP